MSEMFTHSSRRWALRPPPSHFQDSTASLRYCFLATQRADYRRQERKVDQRVPARALGQDMQNLMQGGIEQRWRDLLYKGTGRSQHLQQEIYISAVLHLHYGQFKHFCPPGLRKRG